MKKVSELGNIYHKLTVVDEAESSPDGRARWVCECQCGNRIVARSSRLRDGTTKQCAVCRALERHRKEREAGKEWISPSSKKAQIIAWHKKQQREMEQYALEDYYRYL